MITFLLIAMLPLLMAFLGLIPRTARWLPWTGAILLLVQIPVVVWICVPVFSGETISYGAFRHRRHGSRVYHHHHTGGCGSDGSSCAVAAGRTRGRAQDNRRRFCLFYTLSACSFSRCMPCRLPSTSAISGLRLRLPR